MNEKLSLPISIIIAGLLIGGGIYLNGRITSENPSESNQNAETKDIKSVMRPIDANDHIIGSSDARVVIVEYSDTECPYCKLMHSALLSIMQDYGKDGKVAWVYRHFPIAELHSKSMKESIALECAASLGGNGKFWEYTNKVYEITPSNDGLDPSKLTDVAVEIGLSSEKFNTCLSSGEFEPRVNLDIQNAQELNILGTPYSIVIDTKNGEYYEVEQYIPYSSLKSAIDSILNS